MIGQYTGHHLLGLIEVTVIGRGIDLTHGGFAVRERRGNHGETESHGRGKGGSS